MQAPRHKKKAQEVIVKTAYWNTRCLGDGFKRSLTLETLESLEFKA